MGLIGTIRYLRKQKEGVDEWWSGATMKQSTTMQRLQCSTATYMNELVPFSEKHSRFLKVFYITAEYFDEKGEEVCGFGEHGQWHYGQMGEVKVPRHSYKLLVKEESGRYYVWDNALYRKYLGTYETKTEAEQVAQERLTKAVGVVARCLGIEKEQPYRGIWIPE